MKYKTTKKLKGLIKDSKMPYWTHPGGKLREVGPESLTDSELLSILISTGTKGKSAEKIADEILSKYGSFKGMANQPLEKFLNIKGLGDVKIIRIAAAFEIARRIVNDVLKIKELEEPGNRYKIEFALEQFRGIYSNLEEK